MKLAIITGLLIVLLAGAPATAEFYRYQDEHGNTIYTDDLGKVPQDQRESATAYTESISKPVVPTEAAPESTTPPPSGISEADEEQRQQLEKEGTQLSKEYEALAAEREGLDKEKERAITQTQIKAYNKKIIDFNTRIRAYGEKRDAHTLEVKKFNDRMASKGTDAQNQ